MYADVKFMVNPLDLDTSLKNASAVFAKKQVEAEDQADHVRDAAKALLAKIEATNKMLDYNGLLSSIDPAYYDQAQRLRPEVQMHLTGVRDRYIPPPTMEAAILKAARYEEAKLRGEAKRHKERAEQASGGYLLLFSDEMTFAANELNPLYSECVQQGRVHWIDPAEVTVNPDDLEQA